MASRSRLLSRARTRVGVALAALLAAMASASPATGGEGLFVGATEDMFKLEPALSRTLAADLGLGAARISLHWDAGQWTLKEADAKQLENALTTGVRVVVAVYGWRDTAPQDAASREQYCSYIRDVVERYPQINDVVIWNEPNISFFWRPQYTDGGASAAPAAYAALLGRCWDVLHAVRPTINVIAPATSPWGTDDPVHADVISHSPATFIRKLGDAYRLSGRDRPLFDTVGHHVYGASPRERPWLSHASPRRISQGDLARLVDALQDAFAGTVQGVPGAPAGARVVPIWYMEAGFETVPDEAKRPLYTGTETTAALPDFADTAPWTTLPDSASPAPDQATQLRDAIRLAFCQPYVTGFFNFLLRDQNELNYWQSGVLWADRTRKDSYAAFKDVVGEVNRGTVDCRLFESAPPQSTPPSAPGPPLPGYVESQPLPAAPPQTTTPRGTPPAEALAITKLVWPARKTYRHAHVDWRVAIRVTRDARLRAVISGRSASGAPGARRLVATGRLTADRLASIRFPRRRLAAGTYRIALTVETAVPAPQALIVRSSKFRVAARPR